MLAGGSWDWACSSNNKFIDTEIMNGDGGGAEMRPDGKQRPDGGSYRLGLRVGI